MKCRDQSRAQVCQSQASGRLYPTRAQEVRHRRVKHLKGTVDTSPSTSGCWGVGRGPVSRATRKLTPSCKPPSGLPPSLLTGGLSKYLLEHLEAAETASEMMDRPGACSVTGEGARSLSRASGTRHKRSTPRVPLLLRQGTGQAPGCSRPAGMGYPALTCTHTQS